MNAKLAELSEDELKEVSGGGIDIFSSRPSGINRYHPIEEHEYHRELF